MVAALVEAGHEIVVVTTPPYYPQWKILDGFSGWKYKREVTGNRNQVTGHGEHWPGNGKQNTVACDAEDSLAVDCHLSPVPSLTVIRCPLWVPSRVTGMKRIVHLASFGLSSIPVVMWNAVTFRPDVVMTVEPAAMCMPTSWIAARLCGAKAWLHVQDFEVEAAFELGILTQPIAKKLVLAAEAFLMRRFDRVSTISPNMILKLVMKGVDESRVVPFPNWVDCHAMRPLWKGDSGQGTEIGGQGTGDRGQRAGNGDQEIEAGGSVDGLSETVVPESRVGDADDGPGRLRESFGIPADKLVALYAGNIGAKQGLDIIVDAAKLLAKKPDIHFVICGTGAAFDSVHRAAEGLANVQLMPPQPFERFNELMNCADVHLLPQRSGAADLVMPSKLTGMLATGRAVVACADPGTQIADVVKGHGSVVAAGDTGAFADAIESLATSPGRCQAMGIAARQYALDHLSREAILSRWMVDLQELVGSDDPLADPSDGSQQNDCEPVVRRSESKDKHCPPTSPSSPTIASDRSTGRSHES